MEPSTTLAQLLLQIRSLSMLCFFVSLLFTPLWYLQAEFEEESDNKECPEIEDTRNTVTEVEQLFQTTDAWGRCEIPTNCCYQNSNVGSCMVCLLPMFDITILVSCYEIPAQNSPLSVDPLLFIPVNVCLPIEACFETVIKCTSPMWNEVKVSYHPSRTY